jgi:type VI secretion system secreted protein Hcp
MSIDSYLKLDGVKGEATHSLFKDQIALLNVTVGESNTSNVMGGGSGVGKGKPEPIHFTAQYGTQSPVISKHCIAGTHFKEGTFSFAKSGEGQKVFLEIKIKEGFIISHNITAHANGEITEQVSMSYADIEHIYKSQNEKGAMGGAVNFGYDVRKQVTR